MLGSPARGSGMYSRDGGGTMVAAPLLPSPAPSAAASKGNAIEWLPLQRHPVFDRSRGGRAVVENGATAVENLGGRNLAAWDAAASRLYLWEPEGRRLHRLSVRFGDPDGPAAVEASHPSEFTAVVYYERCDVLVSMIVCSDVYLLEILTIFNLQTLSPSCQINLFVHYISLNREGTSVVLAGSGGLWVMYIYDRLSSSENTTVCRTVSVGTQTFLVQNNILRILQASWHPYSSTHLGVLSSDSVFRIYDLSSDLERPEQEYFLQPVEPGRCQNAASVCPVAFYFGGEHLWDRFTVFILFSDGSVYILCPVVPFGSVFSLPSVKEIYEDASEFRLQSSNSKAVSNCRLAINWLEATFPELTDQGKEKLNLPVLRAHSYALTDASISLQGPLRRVYQNEGVEDSETWVADCEGRAVAFMYNSVGKDSVLVIAWSSGQLQIDALADEVQPLWNVGSSPRLRMNSQGHVMGVAMICEPNLQEYQNMRFIQGTLSNNMVDTLWLGNPPPLLRLAIVDLALPKAALNHPLSIFSDPLLSERIYCLHGGGIDIIVLHFLPFSNINTGVDETARAPSVHPILSTCHNETCSPPLYGFVGVANSFGDSWVVAVMSSFECILLEMKGWKDMLPHFVDVNENPTGPGDAAIHDILRKDLLNGPKVVMLPDSTTLGSLSSDSIEGRSRLHHYIKLFHENYVEYGHKVYIELKQHGEYLKAMLDRQHLQLQEVNELLHRLEDKEPKLNDRITGAFEVYKHLEQRLKNLKNLPAANRKPLSKAEREFKVQLERYGNVELSALSSSVEALNARLRRCLHPSPGGSADQRQFQGRGHVLDARISQLKSSLERLSLVNDATVNKIKLVEQALHSEENAN
ncbi:hypothetical protein Taro_016375 [Colocasia esculenta]|uniref:Nuclear pore complex protein NUP88 n=1 Tax=Colocasia esculenta TaxID=4460 RepID=A0A843USR3_COLES|nr:hypothetical protein [Colocasia esculenta]